jgi:CDP-glucose 4,6-dehydratase
MVSPWKDCRVFVTGHTGFKGSWLTLWLCRLGARVRGYALDPWTTPDMFSRARVGSVVEDVRGDILDFPKLHGSLAEFAPQVVFHLAAQPLVRRSYTDPVGTYAANVMGTAHILESVRKTPGVKAVVCVTTDKCYENREWVWPYRETDALGGFDPYSSSKACAELVAAAFRSSYFPPSLRQDHYVGLATARAGNVIGGGDWSEDRLVPDLIRGFESGVPVRIRRPQAIRPWQHVLEPLRGYLLLAEQLLSGNSAFATAFNFGPGEDDAWAVDRIATKLADLWGDAATWIQDADPGAHEAGYLRLDSSKARAQLHWRPRLNIETALEWTAAWYRAARQSADMQAFSLEQIGAYERLERPADSVQDSTADASRFSGFRDAHPACSGSSGN